MVRDPKPPDLPVRTASGTHVEHFVTPTPPPMGGLDRPVSVGSQRGRSVSGESGLSRSLRLGQDLSQVLPAKQPSLAMVSPDRLLSAFDSVVRVEVTFRDPDYRSPWQSKEVASSVGSGVAIQNESGLYILSAAHVVVNQTFLQVQRTGVEDPDKYVASVYAVCHDCDLALLSVQDELFWEDLKPIALGSNPPLRSLVLVAGFPVGGQELSVTEGVVSRIESQRYSHSGLELLAATVDAAVNPGTSGGPAFNNNGELIGIAFQSLTGANGGIFQINIQTVGHIVLPTVIEKFLEGVTKSGPKGYLGFPIAGINFQPLTNPHLRKLFKVEDTVSGVLVTKVHHGNTCDGILQKNDILTHVADKPIANNGTIALEGRYARTNLATEFTMYQCGDKISLKIIRERKPQTVEVTARPCNIWIDKEFDRDPRFFCWCGVIFQPVSIDYLKEQDQPSSYLCHLATLQTSSEEEHEVVVLSRMLSDSVNVGYEAISQRRIRSVNGESIKDLKDFVDKIEKSSEKLLDIETWQGEVIILPGPSHPDAATANERILKHYRLASDRCLD